MTIEITKPEEGEEAPSVPMLDLFTLEGVTYQIEDRVRPNVSLKWLWLSRTQGLAVADEWLGITLFGARGYLAYLDCTYITQEQSDAIWSLARQIAFGEKAPKSESESQTSTSGPRRKPARTTKPSNGSRTRKPPSKATSRATTGSKIAGKTSPATSSTGSSDN